MKNLVKTDYTTRKLIKSRFNQAESKWKIAHTLYIYCLHSGNYKKDSFKNKYRSLQCRMDTFTSIEKMLQINTSRNVGSISDVEPFCI